ncbi:wall-associated receptor kinase-like 1 [Prunus yedoensis var. nudiflora]|uniref:Wall-associated receptor kinase-like 1 n=1 Tax=Prunus yedoensis var. nudiflora TaxID=2094558 RepID=A0A314U8S2_PRUYE|nr:wall-associated receptor kinase-like 1 [Prunus yedoensis var. nudiflora]
MTILLLWRISTPAAEPDQLGPIAKPSCETHCGDVSIPYPFGIGPSSSCYLYDWFEIHCDNSTSPHKPFLRVAKLEVLNISIQGTLLKDDPQAPNLTGSPFVYSQKYNRFTAVSCGFFALVRSYRDERVVGGCMSTCDKSAETGHNHGCNGINCCQTTLPQNLSVIETQIKSESEESSTSGNDRMFAAYNYAFLVEQDWFRNNLSNFRDVKDMESVPVVLEWSLSLENMNNIDECKGLNNRCKIDDPATNFGDTNRCENYVGGHRCYSIETGITCQYYGTADAQCFFTTRWSSLLLFPIQIILLGTYALHGSLTLAI